jgi:DNA-binding response OmpR family regulator
MTGEDRRQVLEGARILVVEDEMMAASMLEMVLGDCGCIVLGPVPSIEMGLALAKNNAVDAAILDVNLGGEPVFPLADVLVGKKVPFVFVTGYGAPGVDGERYPGAPVVQKPYDDEALVKLIADQLRQRRLRR